MSEEINQKREIYIKLLERRIHNQRVALRNNWMIVEQLADYRKVHPYKSTYLKKLLELYNENALLRKKIPYTGGLFMKFFRNFK